MERVKPTGQSEQLPLWITQDGTEDATRARQSSSTLSVSSLKNKRNSLQGNNGWEEIRGGVGERRGTLVEMEDGPVPHVSISALSPDWECPASLAEKIRSLLGFSDVEIVSMAKQFVAYWTIGKGAGTRRKRWDISFVNWARNQRRFADSRQPASGTMQRSEACGFDEKFKEALGDFPDSWGGPPVLPG